MNAHRDPNASVRFDDRRLAEAVRVLERDGAAPIAPGSTGSIEGGDDFEASVVGRARTVAGADDLVVALGQVDHALRWVAAGVLAAAAIAGAATAAAALGGPAASDGSGRTLNLIELMLAVLGLQTVMLLVWLGLTIGRPRIRATSPLLWLPQAMLRRLARLGARRPESLGEPSRLAAAARATAEPLVDRGLARATAGVLAHATWSTFNIGALLAMVLLMASREYRFTWETTLLDSGTGERIVRTLFAGPQALGIAGPDEDVIVRARPAVAAAQSDDDRRAWAVATLATVALYGLAPRGVLFAGSIAVRGRRRRQWRLDLERPGFARLRATLQPSATHWKEVADERSRPSMSRPVAADADPDDPEAAGDPILLRLETDAPAAWPPVVEGVRWDDVGEVDGRVDEHRVLGAAAGRTPAPSRVVIVAHLATTPDRGHERFLVSLGNAAGRPLRLVLTGGQAIRSRGGATAVTARVDAWRSLARRLGLAAVDVIELDLDHATDVSLDGLAALVGVVDQGAADGPPSPERDGASGESHLDTAFELIVTAAGRWTGAPDPAEQAELHRSIHRRYRVGTPRLAALLGGAVVDPDAASDSLRRLHASTPDALADAMRTSAGRMLDRLPSGLRASPRWAAAGAVAGAVGCLAAAATLTPLAITALPAWAGGAAVLAAVVRTCRTEAGGSSPGAEAVDPAAAPARVAAETAAAVDGAIVLTLLLELQGRGEDVISRVLDGTLTSAESGGLVPGDAASVRRRTDDVRERFDAAMAAEMTR